MKVAYADPPYYKCGRYYDDQHSGSRDWDTWNKHEELVELLEAEYDAYATFIFFCAYVLIGADGEIFGRESFIPPFFTF